MSQTAKVSEISLNFGFREKKSVLILNLITNLGAEMRESRGVRAVGNRRRVSGKKASSSAQEAVSQVPPGPLVL